MLRTTPNSTFNRMAGQNLILRPVDRAWKLL